MNHNQVQQSTPRRYTEADYLAAIHETLRQTRDAVGSMRSMMVFFVVMFILSLVFSLIGVLAMFAVRR